MVLLLRTRTDGEGGGLGDAGIRCGRVRDCADYVVVADDAGFAAGNDDFFSPNAIAFTCALAIYLLQYLSRRKDVECGDRGSRVFLALTLVRTLSKTTLVAFAAGSLPADAGSGDEPEEQGDAGAVECGGDGGCSGRS